jgi:hypothetical protein
MNIPLPALFLKSMNECWRRIGRFVRSFYNDLGNFYKNPIVLHISCDRELRMAAAKNAAISFLLVPD